MILLFREYLKLYFISVDIVFDVVRQSFLLTSSNFIPAKTLLHP